MQPRSPAQIFALVFGVALLLVGVLGFFYNASFSVGDEIEREAVLGVLDVNAWHNLVHLGSGLLGLAVAGFWTGARLSALTLGVAYTVVTVLGFAYGDGGAIIGLIPVNTEDNVLHLVIALSGFAAYFATPEEPAPTLA
ncbi:MAG: DUF4383 domain-containing protein [Thermoleophilaceae bacterium]|nr:DUF4383 domain-containing protein [Thermoleophilaceae bacterium]